jgi:hypothetical protein
LFLVSTFTPFAQVLSGFLQEVCSKCVVKCDFFILSPALEGDNSNFTIYQELEKLTAKF